MTDIAGPSSASLRLNGRAIVIAAVALAAAVGAIWLLSLLLGGAPAPKPPARTPFGVSPQEMAPVGGPFAAWVLGVQSQFYRALTDALKAVRDGVGGASGLVWIGFLYGVFHAAGPGHGKAVIAGYILASERALARGVAISFAAAALQALVAIGLVLVMSVALGATARQMNETTNIVEIASFAAMAALGAWLLWTKSRRLAALGEGPRAIAAQDGDDCGHMHAPPAELLTGPVSARAWFATVIAAGSRPCSGAIILLVFALAQGMLGSGIVGVAAMSLGTALTTSALAALSVFFKHAALKLASGRGRAGLYAVAIGEVVVAALIFIAGAALALGFWTGGAAS
ncbi:MAG: nickel/cobalt transporter [Rhizobiales bacterium]|nr:nickel/cobalt transporter [Hyphomicrobiales bacterium]